MEKMSLQTFFILLVLAVFVGAGIGYILKKLFPSLKDQSMTGQEYTNFLLRQAGKRLPGTLGILIGTGAAFLLFSIRCSLPFSLNIFGLSDTQIFGVLL